jgi:hypothetical protein
LGLYEVEGSEVRVQAPHWGERSAEAALKALLGVAVYRRGGLLLHAAGVAFPRGALVALGPSGAGKSTLSRLAVEAGGVLLSEETVAVFPSAEVWATPFRSDYDAPRGQLTARLAALLTLNKGKVEQVEAKSVTEGVRALLEQAYRPAPGELTPSALLERAGRLALGPPSLACFTFRNDPAAGRFWAERLS